MEAQFLKEFPSNKSKNRIEMRNYTPITAKEDSKESEISFVKKGFFPRKAEILGQKTKRAINCKKCEKEIKKNVGKCIQCLNSFHSSCLSQEKAKSKSKQMVLICTDCKKGEQEKKRALPNNNNILRDSNNNEPKELKLKNTEGKIEDNKELTQESPPPTNNVSHSPSKLKNNFHSLKNQKSELKLKITYPVEDKLLLLTPKKYSINIEKIHNRPKGEKIKIDFELMNKLLLVWDFLITFKDEFFNPTFTVLSDPLEFFKEINNHVFFDEIVCNLTYLLISHIKEDEKYLENKKLGIIGTFIENPNSSFDKIMSHCKSIILNEIIHCSYYNHALDGKIEWIIMKYLQLKPEEISKEEKVIILFQLMGMCYETSNIKAKIELERFNGQAYIKEKENLGKALKDNEKRRKEISYVGSTIPELQEKIKKITEQAEKEEDIDKKSDLQFEIAKIESMITEYDELGKREIYFKEKIKKIRESIRNLKSAMKRKMGTDCLGREYYFFVNIIPCRLYIKDNIKKEWYRISRTKDVLKLLSSLTEKGIKEEFLKHNIVKVYKRFSKNNMDDNDSSMEMEKKSEEEETPKDTKQESHESDTESVVDINTAEEVKEVNREEISQEDIDSIRDIILAMDAKYTEYLSLYGKKWEDYERRKRWKQLIEKTNKMKNFKESLLMLHHRFEYPYTSKREKEDPKTLLNFYSYYFEDKNAEKYYFYDDCNHVLYICKKSLHMSLAPKVRLYKKDLITYNIPKYFETEILTSMNSLQEFFFALHFFEFLVFGLIKRNLDKSIKK